MTALKQYERLEAAALWRAGPDAQRRDVIVSLGEATLTITDMNDRPLGHWSLAALERVNPGEVPAIFHPAGDDAETLEIDGGETAMLEAISKLRSALERGRPRPGRLRAASILTSLGLIAGVLGLWLPGALQRHTVNVVPDVQRKAIGQALLGRIERVAGQACNSPGAAPVLARLAGRSGAGKIVVLPSGVASSLSLPGGIVILNRALIEDHEDPAVAAGAVLAERARADALDPLADLLSHGGLMASFRLLTTGSLTRDTLDRYAETALSQPRPNVPQDKLLEAFGEAAIPSKPYAYALDVTGETVLGLIEADPMSGRELEPVLPDRDWVRLQSICGG
jgi:hypothetical protein